MSTQENELKSKLDISEEKSPLRFVTAASLFDGHDAAINVMRRMIQAEGAEVIHLGHNRSVKEIVEAAIQEDADGIAISSYQGGHNEFFKYMYDMLDQLGAQHIKIFGGGGGTITEEEIAILEEYGIEKIYHPNDGMRMGLDGMIKDLIARCKKSRTLANKNQSVKNNMDLITSKMISAIEDNDFSETRLNVLRKEWELASDDCVVVGITGTGGSGKSSVTDEIMSRFKMHLPKIRIGVLAVDPTRRRTGGALLGDRIRMNSLRDSTTFMRSMATRRQHKSTSAILKDAITYMRSLDFNLIIVETAGIGQSDSEIVDLVDLSVYVMTSEYGASSQLEKIDMLDFADLIILNKFDKKSSADALRDIKKQWKRNHNKFDCKDEDIPVYPTIASQFNDDGLSYMFTKLCGLIQQKSDLKDRDWTPASNFTAVTPDPSQIIPASRSRYLAEISENSRIIDKDIQIKSKAASLAYSLYKCLSLLDSENVPEPLNFYENIKSTDNDDDHTLVSMRQEYNEKLNELGFFRQELKNWAEKIKGVKEPEYKYQIRDKTLEGKNFIKTLSGLDIPKISPPKFDDWGLILAFIAKENLPGFYPFTGGVFPYRRSGEDPIRMFAGEGTPERTNARFHYLAEGQEAVRLSTAFDSVTLYGEDPHHRPDIYGKVGNSGVSVADLDDAKKLYSGFDLCAPSTSVSMTINGPAPIILAFFMNTAIDQQVELYLKNSGKWNNTKKSIEQYFKDKDQPQYGGTLPNGNEGLGLGFLGLSSDKIIDKLTYDKIKAETLSRVRGTVQADILKEDQAQNTCIFSTEFSLRLMGDVQQYFIEKSVRNFYSVSISGYHIAEAGANPISQLAFTLSNGFTIVEYYLARGMKIDDFAPNLSFFFSNGMDPEYTVIGRVARRIWARAMRERYGASERSQKLKYHIQTSGRSLHAQEISFNDIRTTLQALCALFDNCNSLHTNAYDEAITTPTEESVRRAVAIQLIINREFGLNFCENPIQGAFIVDELTDLVEEAVLKEFENISSRGGVLGAMDTMYQRSKIQDESMLYETKKHDGSLPLIGVNTFLAKNELEKEESMDIELIRSTSDEKENQISNLSNYQKINSDEAELALHRLKQTAINKGNCFEELMETTKSSSLGQISNSLYEVGGEYRRSM
ncbi:MAG: methylmalonyl-CoA mutase family protein [Pseudomonadota bacterium]|nr:methylmalonyl-CoA mutase family protein [Pseudomonadota bacterium]